jgi:predicted DNA-binding transcriptional regulator AlpA
MEDEFLTTDEVASLLKVSNQLLRSWRHKGDGPPYIKIGPRDKGIVRYSSKALAEYLTSNLK